jgi:HEAT repeat protein
MLASALLGVLTIGAPSPGPSLDELAAVRAVLRRSDGATAARDDVLVRRLVALGAGAAPALFSLASGEGIELLLVDDAPEAWMCPPERVGEIALAALADLPAVPVRDFLRTACQAHPSLEVRITTLNVLGRQGSAEGLELYFEILAQSDAELEHRTLRATACGALLAMLRKDGAAANLLEKPLLAASRPAQLLACEALADCNRGAAVRLLTKLFGRDSELDLAALDGLTRLGAQFPWRVGDEVATRLRAALGQENARMRAAAAQALGKIRDPQATPALIALLADEDGAARRAAQWALRETTGEKRITTAAEWHGWLEAESAWWREEGQGWLAALDPAESTRLTEAMRELLAHPFGRDQTADALAGALAELDPAAQLVACDTLARLGSRRAVPALIELLFEPGEELRNAVWAALRALTGEDLPAEPQLWEAYAFD